MVSAEMRKCIPETEYTQSRNKHQNVLKKLRLRDVGLMCIKDAIGMPCLVEIICEDRWHK
jgi:hypothetical protein